jgi:hypothetical protein
MFKVFSVLAAVVALAFALGVQAATLNFFVTINGDFEAFSWDQSSAPVPTSYQTGSYTDVSVLPRWRPVRRPACLFWQRGAPDVHAWGL